MWPSLLPTTHPHQTTPLAVVAYRREPATANTYIIVSTKYKMTYNDRFLKLGMIFISTYQSSASIELLDQGTQVTYV